MLKYIKRLWDKIADRNKDPVYRCGAFTSSGCSHRAGYRCNMENCALLRRHAISIMPPEQKVEFVRKLTAKLFAIDKTNK